MANLNETDQWEAGIYQLEEDDPVLGGPTGVDNVAPRQLANRGRYQRLRNVTPWDATLTYPANVAYVSYGGTTWKSVGESLNVVPGTDAAKWVRWAFTEAELTTVLGNAVAVHEAKVNPHPQYATDDDLAAHAAAADPHAQYVRHDAAQGLTNAQAAQARANVGAEPAGTAVSEIQKNAARYAVDIGVVNVMAAAFTPAVGAVVDGMELWVKAKFTNTGPTTLNVNGTGALPVLGSAHSALQGGEIVAGGQCLVVANAALGSWVLIECTGAAVQVANASKSQQAVAVGQLFGGLKGIAVFTANGNFTVPAGVTTVYVSGCAGGAGGAGGGGSTNQLGTGGGGGGGGAGQPIVRKPFVVVPGAVHAITIGAGGSAGTAGNPVANGGVGGAGGSTVVGTLVTLNGAAASTGGGYYTGVGVPGGGFSGTGYPNGNSGNDGANGFNAGVGNGGMGASGPFGGGGGGTRAGSTGGGGSPAYGYGCGGGGGGGGYGSGGGGANGGAGSNGAPGLVIIEW